VIETTSIQNARYSRHGMSGTREYRIWAGMIQRCTNPNSMSYDDYGGRGITVCQDWLRFENFYRDMGDAPFKRSLDRINNDLGYYPDNCRWSTATVQASNRRLPVNPETGIREIRSSNPPCGKGTIDSDSAMSLRRLASRFLLKTNRRITYREVMAIVESGMDDATLDLFIARYQAANDSSVNGHVSCQ
jgi:hypothetical protein